MSSNYVDGRAGAGLIPTVARAGMFALFAVSSLMVGVPSAQAADDPTSMVRDADHILRGKTTAGVMAMQIHTSAYDRSYDMVYWEDLRAAKNRVLVKILGPAEWRNHGTLKTEGRVTMYNPSTDRMTSLSNSMLGDSWMGSHFTNDDFVKETDLARDYTATDEKQWQGKGADGKDATYHRLMLKPTPNAPVRWDHIVLEVYREDGRTIPTKFEYYRRADSGVTRTLTFSNVKDIGGRTAPTLLTMTVADKPGEYTKVNYQKLKFDADVPTNKFTEQALRQ